MVVTLDIQVRLQQTYRPNGGLAAYRPEDGGSFSPLWGSDTCGASGTYLHSGRIGEGNGMEMVNTDTQNKTRVNQR